MPNIKPISDLRNYTEVLQDVTGEEKGWLTLEAVEKHLGIADE